MEMTFVVNGDTNNVFSDRNEAIKYAEKVLGLDQFEVESDKDRLYEVVITSNHRYRISSTKHSSARYGNCEVCDKHASEIYIQTVEQKKKGRYLSQGTIFGHKECLENIRLK